MMMMADIPRLMMVPMMSRLKMSRLMTSRLMMSRLKNHLWAALSADPDLSSVAFLRVQRHPGLGILRHRPSW